MYYDPSERATSRVTKTKLQPLATSGFPESQTRDWN